MKTYIALLRGINVSGQKMIKMEALRNMFEALKYKNISSYIQSGNILFRTKTTAPETLENDIQKAILKTFGFDVEVIITQPETLQEIVAGNPFMQRKDFDTASFYVSFLSAEPEAEHITKLTTYQTEKDEFHLAGKVVYLFPKKGYGNSKLNNNFFENKLKIKATTRNWKTINELIRMAEVIE